MIKTIEPHANISVPSIERMLFVLHPAALEMIKQRRRWYIRDNLLHHRANPRSVEYMLECAGDFKVRYAPNTSIDLLTASPLDPAVSEKHRSWIGQIWAGTSVGSLVEQGYDTVTTRTRYVDLHRRTLEVCTRCRLSRFLPEMISAAIFLPLVACALFVPSMRWSPLSDFLGLVMIATGAVCVLGYIVHFRLDAWVAATMTSKTEEPHHEAYLTQRDYEHLK